MDTSAYDRLPISTFIYEPVARPDKKSPDFRIVYANHVFARDWKAIYHNDNYIGALLKESTLMDEYSLHMMERFLTEKPRSFSTYMPMVRLHLHFEPMTDLPAPYAGFFLTNLTDYEEKEARAHFLRNISQMKNNAVLLRRHEDGHLESVYVSESFAQMMECGVKEAVRMVDGMGFFHVASLDDRPFVRSILKRRVTDGGGSNLTVQVMTARHNPIWCDMHFAFIDDFGEHYVYCTYTNVTVLKRYEERLRSVYTSLGSSFYQADEQTLGLFRVNLTRDVVEEVNGRDLFPTDSPHLPYSELMARRAVHYPITEEREHLLRVFDRERMSGAYLEGRVSASEILYSRRKDGRDCFVEFSASLTRHPLTGDMIAFITERECNAEKVRETLLRKILAQQFDMVAYLVNGDYGVSIGNAAYIKKGSIFPLTRQGQYQQYLDNQVRPVLHGTEEYRETVMKALSLESVREQTRVHEPYVVNIAIEVDGEVFYKRFDFYPVSPEARFYIVLKSDVTELRREQSARNAQLRSALEEAQQANVAKTAFLSSMSHEIRTPMNAIIGLDSIALNEPGLPEHTKEHLEKIGSSARHLLGIINDILDMSRIESGRMVLKNEEFSFRDMLEQINTMIGGQCQERGLRYDVRIIEPVSPYYIGDDMKLKQVLINILGNAVKFTPAPGTVSFRIEQVSRFQDQSTLRFTIQDTGIGMDPDYLPKLFDAFTQEDAATTNRYGGSGLGMAITKNIVEMMNGTITVASEKGVGSTFTVHVTLRGCEHAQEQTEEEQPRAADLTGRHILLAEDMAINAEIMIEILEMMDMTVEHAENGKIALELFSENPEGHFDAILMDMRMPEMDGLQATMAIRAFPRPDAKKIPIIALTANAFTEDVQRSLQAGMNAHLSKPVEPERLYDTLAKLIRD